MDPLAPDPTRDYWQQLLTEAPPDRAPPWQRSVPVPLPDGRWLRLPIRPLPHEPGHAVASLLLNHAALDVTEALAALLAQRVAGLGAELVVGLPTLGLALAPLLARALGQSRYVPLGYSRKFWYEEALSAAVVSVTSPTPGKRVYLDPHLRALVEGKRVLLVDDAVSTGRTANAPWDLLESLGCEVLALAVVMRQGRRWQAELGPARAERVIGVFDSPLLMATPNGWIERT